MQSINADGAVNEARILKYDEALVLAGGFGKFQKIAFTCVLFTILSGEFMINTLMFMLLLPVFECEFASSPGLWTKCKQVDFCPTEGVDQQTLATRYRINWQSPYSLQNWVQRFGLECAEKYQFGLLGSAVFVGWAIGSLIIPRLADIYGRKYVLVCNQAL